MALSENRNFPLYFQWFANNPALGVVAAAEEAGDW